MKYLLFSVLLFSNICFSETISGLSKKELINPATNGRIWVYLPKNYQTSNVPVVLIPPAGTRLFHGIDLGDGDGREHIPYVKEGMAVISFDLSGPWPAVESDQNIYAAITRFVARNGGVDDAKDALTIAKKKFPNLNTDEVYVAGHSSAATIALMIAQQVPGLKGVIAYAPIIDTEVYLAEVANAVSGEVPMFKKVLIDRSPHKNLSKYTMPVFLFVAKDDDHMFDQMKSYKIFIKALKKSGEKLTYKQVSSGGHYQSMIDEGIPAAISWLKSLKQNKLK